jgi:hypothetical protein
MSEANNQLSSINISPSSWLIFLTPMGLSCCNLSFRLITRFACTSSSGKYFKCFGTLCGHCSSADDVVAQSSAMMAGGSDKKLGRCIIMSRMLKSRANADEGMQVHVVARGRRWLVPLLQDTIQVISVAGMRWR